MEPKKEDVVILALTQIEDVISAVHNKLWNIVILNQREWSLIESFKLMVDLKLDYKNEFIDFKEFVLPNLYRKVDETILRSWLIELVDLAYPYLGYDGPFNEGKYEYYGAILKSGDYVFDCGANLGVFSAVAAQKGCKVFAFEPSIKCASFIDEINVKCHTNINIVDKCIADYNGETDFLEIDNSLGSSNIFNSTFGCTGPMNKKIVNVTTIDSFVNDNHIPRVDYIKADIEGAERYMLRGATNTIKRYSPRLSICTYHNWDDVQVLTDIIKDINPNYIIKYAWKKLYAWCPDNA